MFENGSFLQTSWRAVRGNPCAHPLQELVEQDKTNKEANNITHFALLPDADYDTEYFNKLGDCNKKLALKLSYYLLDKYHVMNEIQNGVGIQSVANGKEAEVNYL